MECEAYIGLYATTDRLAELKKEAAKRGQIIETDCDGIINWLKTRPVVDVAPVKHGEWLLIEKDWGDYWKCSRCQEEFDFEDGTPVSNGYCYCPYCGARMDGQ